MQRTADDLERSCSRVLNLFYETGRCDGFLIQRVADAIDRTVRNIRSIQYLLPLGDRALLHNLGNHGLELSAMGEAVLDGAETRIVGEVFTPDGDAELAPENSYVQRQYDVTVLNGNQTIRHDAVVVVAHTARILAGHEID